MIEAVVTQDDETKAIYISLQTGDDRVAHTRAVGWPMQVLVDLDEEENVIGIEILGISLPLATSGP